MTEWQVPTVGSGTPVPQPAVAGPAQAPASAGDGKPVFFEPGTKAPSTGSFWTPADWEDHLHLWLGNTGPIEIDTQWGQKEGASCQNIVVFTQDGFELFQTQNVVQTVLARQLSVKRNVVGRLSKGTATDAGKAAPWVISDPSAEDVQFANSWLAGNATQKGQDIVLNFF